VRGVEPDIEIISAGREGEAERAAAGNEARGNLRPVRRRTESTMVFAIAAKQSETGVMA